MADSNEGDSSTALLKTERAAEAAASDSEAYIWEEKEKGEWKKVYN